MNNNQEYTSNLTKLLLAFKDNIMSNTHVATLGIIKSIDGDLLVVEPFPLLKDEKSYNICCYKLENLEFETGDVGVVLFIDRNFIQNLKQIKSGNKISNLNTNNLELHLEKYGILIGKM